MEADRLLLRIFCQPTRTVLATSVRALVAAKRQIAKQLVAGFSAASSPSASDRTHSPPTQSPLFSLCKTTFLPVSLRVFVVFFEVFTWFHPSLHQFNLIINVVY